MNNTTSATIITDAIDEIEFKVKDRPLTKQEKQLIKELLMRLDSRIMEHRLDELLRENKRENKHKKFFDRFLLSAIQEEFQRRSGSDVCCCFL